MNADPNAEHDAFHDTVLEAIHQHGVALGGAVPDFEVLMATHQRRARFLLAAATAVVVVCGLGGVVLVANRSEPAPAAEAPVTFDDTSPGDRSASSAPLTDEATASTDDAGTAPVPTTDAASTAPSSTGTGTGSTVASEPVTFSCTDPLGEDRNGRRLFGSCEPRPGGVDGDYACTEQLGSDNGFVRFSTCEAIGQLGPLPDADGETPVDDPDDLPVRATPYEVRAGDYGLKIAEQFCVSIADLETVNGWADVSREFPAPGVEILIPDAIDGSNCSLATYTIGASDTSRAQVADMFCISVEALDTANVDTAGYSAFYPGLEIVIPHGPSTAC